MIEARDVRVRLGGAEILRGLDFTVARGEWLGLLGPNGAGKTTALRALAGLVPYAGSIAVDGVEARTAGRRRLARSIAFVPQLPERPPELTVAEYVLLGRTPHLGYLATPGRHDRERADAAMDRLDVTGLARRRLARLSGGERQRAVLARALASDPQVLLLDEPTSMLDVGHEQQVLELVDTLRKDAGLTVISTLHDLTVAGQYADTLVLLDGGQVVAAGSPAAVLTKPLIESVYAARVSVITGSDGHPVVAPRRGPSGEPR